MTPEERAQRKAEREKAERERSRDAARAAARKAIAEHGRIPEHLLREVIRPALIDGAKRANRSKRKGA